MDYKFIELEIKGLYCYSNYGQREKLKRFESGICRGDCRCFQSAGMLWMR